MKFMKSWTGPRIKNPGTQISEKPTAQAMPNENLVSQVKPIDNQMSKFRGTERKLAHFRNLFRQSTDKTGDAD